MMLGPRKDSSMNSDLHPSPAPGIGRAHLGRGSRFALSVSALACAAALSCTQPNNRVDDEGGDGGATGQQGDGGRKAGGSGGGPAPTGGAPRAGGTAPGDGGQGAGGH